jgi:hypothetical protein
MSVGKDVHSMFTEKVQSMVAPNAQGSVGNNVHRIVAGPVQS